MKTSFVPTALMAAIVGVTQAANLINGNWYANAVDSISYTNWGVPGIYNKITDMTNGQCKSSPQTYAGGMSPLDGEISWHFRGPMHLKQFAAYTLGSSSSKREIASNSRVRRHDHNHAQHQEEKRAVGDMVTATINGVVVSWVNEYSGQATTTAPIVARPTTTAATFAHTVTSTTSAVAPAKTSLAATNAGAGKWGRSAYYNAQQGVANGLVFLNSKGGQGSGVFDYTWGNSLSYASSDATSGASSPQILKDTLIPDSLEFSIFTDKKCTGTSCGAVRPGTVAYHGFDGASKLFLLEFAMPLSGKRGFNADMPAAWILNAQIPRTMQYGPAECSCWTSGCGEWDIFEVLDSGNTRCKSTFHGLRSGGDSDYFQRPTSNTMKAAVIFDGISSAGHIVVLPDSTSFTATISDAVVAGFVNSIASSVRSKAIALS